MTRAALIRLVLAGCLLAGCRSPHLGTDTGVAYRNALEAQADAASRPDDGPGFDADVAHAALARRRRAPEARSAATLPGVVPVTPLLAAPATGEDK